MRPSSRSARIGSTARARPALDDAEYSRAYDSPVNSRPRFSNFSGKTIPGVRFEVTNRDLFSSSQLGLALAALRSAVSKENCAGCEPESDRQQRGDARARNGRRCPPAANAGISGISGATPEISCSTTNHVTGDPGDASVSYAVADGRLRLPPTALCVRPCSCFLTGRPRFFASTIHDGGRPRRRPRPRANRSRLKIASSSCSRSWRNSSRIFETSIGNSCFLFRLYFPERPVPDTEQRRTSVYCYRLRFLPQLQP